MHGGTSFYPSAVDQISIELIMYLGLGLTEPYIFYKRKKIDELIKIRPVTCIKKTNQSIDPQ